jgi:hypothetical protein
MTSVKFDANTYVCNLKMAVLWSKHLAKVNTYCDW